jgi:hypothetical protein
MSRLNRETNQITDYDGSTACSRLADMEYAHSQRATRDAIGCKHFDTR